MSVLTKSSSDVKVQNKNPRENPSTPLSVTNKSPQNKKKNRAGYKKSLPKSLLRNSSSSSSLLVVAGLEDAKDTKKLNDLLEIQQVHKIK